MPKLVEEDKRKFLREKLEEQRHLLGKSIKDLCAGDLVEAMRVATAIRVLVHETANSKPLLKQLTSSYLELAILDEPPRKEEPPPPGAHAVVVMHVPIAMKITEKGVFLEPNLAGYARSIVGKWWTRPSLIVPGIGGLSRKEVVLGLTNKEGGAHVDPEMTPKYRKLLAYHALRMGMNEVTPLNLSRLMAGQAGVELLDCLDQNFPLGHATTGLA